MRQVQRAFGGLHASRIGNRMRGLQNLERRYRKGVAVLGDDQATADSAAQRVQGTARHRARRLAGPQHGVEAPRVAGAQGPFYRSASVDRAHRRRVDVNEQLARAQPVSLGMRTISMRRLRERFSGVSLATTGC